MLLAADNLNALNPIFRDALMRMDPLPIRELVLRCEKAGAHLIDLNPGYLSKRHEDRMRFLVETVQETTCLRLILDNPNPRILAAGLSVCREKPILNALSLEREKIEGILPLAVEYATDLVILLMDERSFSPPSADENIALALQLTETAVSAGLTLDRLIIDPVLPNMSWDDALFRIAEDIRTIRLLSTPAVFGEPVRTMIGLSNLRSGIRHRHPFSLEATCLALLAGAGLGVALADVLQPGFGETFQGIQTLVTSHIS